MNDRSYPYTAWTLTPSFKPVELTLWALLKHSSGEWDIATNRKWYHVSKLHLSKSAAIAFGRAEIARQRADLDKKIANLAKREAELNKAEKA